MKKNKRYYPELEKQIIERGLKKCEMAEFLYLTPCLMSYRMTGKTSFTLEEAIKLRDKYFPDMSVEDLFRR